MKPCHVTLCGVDSMTADHFSSSPPTVKPRTVLLFLTLYLLCYVTTYLALSRRGYNEAAKWNMYGFYYLPPSNSFTQCTLNDVCVGVFYPLNKIDQGLGYGKCP